MKIDKPSFLSSHCRHILIHSVVAACLILLSIMISSTKIVNKFERQLTDLQFLIRGENNLNDNIILVLIDNETVGSIGHAPYSQESFALIARGLHILGAKVIGFDFIFENHHHPATDSLLAQVVSDSSNISYAGKAFQAFCIEVIRRYFNISHNQINMFADKIVINTPDGSTIILPVHKSGKILINYLGDESAFKNRFCFAKILQLSEEIINTDFHSNISSVFKDKIVLIGSVVDDKHFVTPFSETLPSVMLQATLISNILNNNFINPTNKLCSCMILTLIGFLITYMSIKWKVQRALLGTVVVLLIFNMAAVFMFIYYNTIVKLIPANLFLIFSIISLALMEEIKLIKILTRRKEKLSEQSLHLTKMDEKFINPDLSEPYYKIIIPLIKLRDECVLTHTLESEKKPVRGLGPFETGLQTKHAHIFNINKLNKLSHDIERLWQIYNSFTRDNKRFATKPIDLLKKIGHRVTTEFGLSATLDNIFKFATPETYLNFVIDDLTIPWQWAYNLKQDRFLCDHFPTSVSFAIEKADFDNHVKNEEESLKRSAEKGAVLLYGSWRRHPTKKLHYVDTEISSIKKIIGKVKNSNVKSSQIVDEFLSQLDYHSLNRTNLRIIHYSGHIEGDRMDVSETQYLRAGSIKHTRNLYFHSHPVVFLNGCNSGNLGYLWDKYDDLATEFLACGAAACIITHFDIIETTACKFSIQFYKNFIDRQMTAGEALRQTRIDLSKKLSDNSYDPDYDITRYFYNIYGDPAVAF